MNLIPLALSQPDWVAWEQATGINAGRKLAELKKTKSQASAWWETMNTLVRDRHVFVSFFITLDEEDFEEFVARNNLYFSVEKFKREIDLIISGNIEQIKFLATNLSSESSSTTIRKLGNQIFELIARGGFVKGNIQKLNISDGTYILKN